MAGELKKTPVIGAGPVELVSDGSGIAVLHVDGGVLEAKRDPADHRLRFGMLVETPAFPKVAEVLTRLRQDPEKFMQHYRLLFVYDPTVAALHPRVIHFNPNCTWIRDAAVHPKTKLVSMITSSKAWFPGHRRRLAFAERARDKLDLFGRGFKEIDNKLEGLQEYMFSVAIENAVWPGYFTEKILDCFLTGTVPVYSGDPLIGTVFNLNGIVLLRGPHLPALSPELYQRMLPAIQENYNRALMYRQHTYARLWDEHLSKLPELAADS
jgi:hypothetical protein